MLLIHPIVQFLSTLLGLYVFITGLQRFRSLHLGQKAAFQWRRHVSLGVGVIILWLGGLAGGLIVVKQVWYTNFITGRHAQTAMIMLPLMLFALASGLFMHFFKKRRTLLPLFHGLNNLVLLLLAVFQIYSGWHAYRVFVMGP